MFKKRPKEFESPRRVMTTQSAAPVFSYRASRVRTEAPLGRNDERPKARRTHTWLINLPTYAALIVMIGSVLYALTLDATPRIDIYNASESVLPLRDEQVYASAARDIMGQSVLNYTKPTIDTGHIATEMQRKFPEVNAASIAIPLIDRQPIMQIALATPKLILQTKQGSLVVSDTGRALVNTSSLPKDTHLTVPTVIDQTGLQVKAGDRALTASSVTFIETVLGQLQAKGVSVQSLTLPTTPEELDVRLAGKKYYLKFNLLNDARQQAGSYLALQQKLDDDHTTPAEYIDLRVDEHVYYK